MRRWLSVAFALIACAIVAMFALRSALTRPFQAPAGPPPAGAKPIHFASESGAEIHGWWWDARDAKGVVLLLPGVRANRRSMVDRATFLHAAGYTTMLVDFQATGESRGKAITFGDRERHDVLGAVAFARKQAPHAKLAIIGSSLGGAATLLATPLLDVDAMVLEAVYPSICIAR
ncbi:MAG TPA: alpha/beta hydrolase [Thermoanaerobaculia bacterium]